MYKATTSLDEIVVEIGSEFFGNKNFASETSGPDERVKVILQVLQKNAMLLVWDNFQNLFKQANLEICSAPTCRTACSAIRTFLEDFSQAGGPSAVLITSCAEERWLDEGGRSRLVMGHLKRLKLKGFKKYDAETYAQYVLSGSANTRVRPAKDPEGYQALLDCLEGHPRKLKTILPKLEKTPAATLVQELRDMSPPPPASEEKDTAPQALQHSKDHETFLSVLNRMVNPTTVYSSSTSENFQPFERKVRMEWREQGHPLDPNAERIISIDYKESIHKGE